MASCPGRPRIYVDYREEGKGVAEALTRLGAAIFYQQLDIGDYVISDRIVVERKTIDDLARSVFDGRLFDQARRLAEYYEIPVLIVEGDLSMLEKITEKVVEVKMALIAASIDLGIRVIYSGSVLETAKLLYHMACREQYGSRRPVIIHRKRRFEQLWMQQLYVVQSLPSIGPRLAEKLLERFGSIEAICRASIVELENVLGEARARQVYRVIHMPYKPNKPRLA